MKKRRCEDDHVTSASNLSSHDPEMYKELLGAGIVEPPLLLT
jgi:hypothetical protein